MACYAYLIVSAEEGEMMHIYFSAISDLGLASKYIAKKLKIKHRNTVALN
jgi:hypothetical protein